MTTDAPLGGCALIRLVFGGRLVQGAWALLLVGLGLYVLFLAHVDLRAMSFVAGTVERVPGRVVETAPVVHWRAPQGWSVVLFEYEVPGLGWARATSLAEAPGLVAGGEVEVEVVRERPEVARLVGGRSDLLPGWLGVLGVVPLAGVLGLLLGLRRTRRRLEGDGWVDPGGRCRLLLVLPGLTLLGSLLLLVLGGAS